MERPETSDRIRQGLRQQDNQQRRSRHFIHITPGSDSFRRQGTVKERDRIFRQGCQDSRNKQKHSDTCSGKDRRTHLTGKDFAFCQEQRFIFAGQHCNIFICSQAGDQKQQLPQTCRIGTGKLRSDLRKQFDDIFKKQRKYLKIFRI